MLARRAASLTCILVLAAGSVRAQPAVVAPEAAAPPAAVPPSAVAIDPPEVKATYDRAFAALIVEQWSVAAAGFAEVAAKSVEAERRGAAAELSRFAREMDREKGPTRASGRADFVVTTTLASFYASFALVDVFGVDNYKNATLLVTGTTLAGFGASLFATNGRTITDSMAASYGSGLLIGLGNGLLLASPLGIDPESECSTDPLIGCPDGEVNQNFLLFGLGAMAVGGAAGTYLAYRFEPTAPQSRFVSLMGANGLVTTGLGLVLADADELSQKTVLGLLALGLDAGVVGGALLGRDLDWSSARVTYVTLAEFLGGLTAGAIAVVSLDEDGGSGQGQAAAGIVLAGVWGGFGLATYLTRGMKPHPRYRLASPPPVSLVPLVTPDGGRGIALGGRF